MLDGGFRGLFLHLQAAEEFGVGTLGDGDLHLVDACARIVRGDGDAGTAGDGQIGPGGDP